MILDNQDINKTWHIYGDTIENKKTGRSGWLESASNDDIGKNIIIIRGDIPNYIYDKVRKLLNHRAAVF